MSEKISLDSSERNHKKRNPISQNSIGPGYTGDRMVPFISMSEQA